MELIGEKIRSIRKSKGISQTAVADSCRIKQSSYANIENGKTQNITIEIGKGIAKALGISFNELFEIEATPQNQSEAESLIIEIEGLKKQIEDIRKNSKKDEQIIDLLKQLNSNLKNAILETYFSSMTFLSFEILKLYENNEQKDLIFSILNDFTEEFKKELIANACYSVSEFELFMDKRKQLFELEVIKKKNLSWTKGSEML